jgi:polyhydroxyalkanoate synthesis regulator protein
MKRRHLYLLIILLALIGGTAGAQTAGTRSIRLDGAGPLSSNLILERWTISIERDLKVSDELAQKLTLVRTEYRAALQKAYEDAGINPQDVPFRLSNEQRDTEREITRKLLREFIPKAAALLSPDQITRFQQIDLQIQLRTIGADALLAPDVASALKLADDQKRTLNALIRDNRAKRGLGFDSAAYLEKGIAVLTDEQKETLSKLKGEEFKDIAGQRPAPPAVAVKAGAQGGLPFFSVGRSDERVPEVVHFATIEAVQKDLGVSAEVARKLTQLRDDYRAGYEKERQNADLPQPPYQLTQEISKKLGEIRKKVDDEFIPKVNAMLSADQQKRLAQIRFQNSIRNLGPLALSPVASELKLTDDQQQKLTALTTEFRAQQREIAPTGRTDPEAAAKLSKVKEEFWSKAVELLSAEQKAALETLKGREFDTSQLVIRGATQGKGN